MSLSDLASARKPPRKASRAWLVWPWTLAIVLVAGWCGAWFLIKAQALRTIDFTRDSMNASGYRIDWTRRDVHGFPFRLDVDFERLSVREPSGWAIAAPRLKTEAWAYAPGHWLLVAPDGVVITRPEGGPVTVGARVLRASLAGFDRAPPRISVEGKDLTFTPADGARPFFVTAASGFQFHVRPGPDDQAAVFLQLDGAQARLTGLFGRIAGDKPVSLTADAILSHASALSGPDWPTAVRTWTVSEGALQVRQVRIAAGDALLDARAGRLTVGIDGRLRGSLTASLREAPRALSAMGAAGTITPEAADAATTVAKAEAAGPQATVTLDFVAGRTTLGPVGIGPSPRVY